MKAQKIPMFHNGMRFVKEYPNFVLYEKKYKDMWGNEQVKRECFSYWDLGINTKQGRRERRIYINNHL